MSSGPSSLSRRKNTAHVGVLVTSPVLTREMHPLSEESPFLLRAGICAAMSEFLARGINVAPLQVPGEDGAFLALTEDRTVPVQIYASQGQELRNRGLVAALFRIPLDSLRPDATAAGYAVLAVRNEHRWQDFVILHHTDLAYLHNEEGIGFLGSSEKDGPHDTVLLRMYFSGEDATCSGHSFVHHLNNFKLATQGT